MKSVISAMQFLLSIDKQPNALALQATNIKQVTTWRTIQKILNASAFQQLFGLIQKNGLAMSNKPTIAHQSII